MKLWLIEPVAVGNDTPWSPWYDKAFGFVIAAETEAEAREIADANAGDENQAGHPWLDDKLSACVELDPQKHSGVVMRDFEAG